MCFEEVYEKELQMTLEDKAWITDAGIAVWLMVDGKLAGECFGISTKLINDDDPDIAQFSTTPNSIYCYGTTILPPYQGQGLGKILVANWNRLARGQGYDAVLGHATSPSIVKIREFFGAKVLASHEGWMGTRRTAHFYEQPL